MLPQKPRKGRRIEAGEHFVLPKGRRFNIVIRRSWIWEIVDLSDPQNHKVVDSGDHYRLDRAVAIAEHIFKSHFKDDGGQS